MNQLHYIGLTPVAKIIIFIDGQTSLQWQNSMYMQHICCCLFTTIHTWTSSYCCAMLYLILMDISMSPFRLVIGYASDHISWWWTWWWGVYYLSISSETFFQSAIQCWGLLRIPQHWNWLHSINFKEVNTCVWQWVSLWFFYKFMFRYCLTIHTDWFVVIIIFIERIIWVIHMPVTWMMMTEQRKERLICVH